MTTTTPTADRAEEQSTVISDGAASLARLRRVDLRKAWTTEDQDFTPWLVKNLDVLAETLGMELKSEAREKSVGPFRADILCKEIGSDSWVLIENQLERTDHSHLGQLLTYAAGLEAVTIVWIAKSFTEEHRAALDWLNGITDEHFRFFGLEVELWRIGTSPAAPKFNVVSKPNDWSRSVSRAAAGGEVSETQLLQIAYWRALQEVLKATPGPVSSNRRPRPLYLGHAIGRTGFSLNAVMVPREGRIRTELYISGSDAKTFFSLLSQQKEEIEKEFGDSLDWQELPEGQDCRIAYFLDGVDPMNEAGWSRQHLWLAEQLNAMHSVFSDRVRNLNLADGLVFCLIN